MTEPLSPYALAHISAALDWTGKTPFPFGPYDHRPRKTYGPRKGGFVYFIAGEDGPVKIGYSAHPRRRLKALQSGSPLKLRILAQIEGDQADEKEFHRRFQSIHSHGEWFERTDELMAEVSRLARPFRA